MIGLTPEIMEKRFWLNSYDNYTKPVLNYPKYPAHEILRLIATTNPDKAATDFYGTEISYWDLYGYSTRLANGLITAGIKKGDRVGILLPNCPQMVISFWAILQAGGTIVNLNPMYKPEELKGMIEKTGMTGLITFDGAIAGVQQLSQMVDLSFVMVTKLTDFIDGMKTSTPEELGLPEDWHHFSQFLAQSTNQAPPAIVFNTEEDAAILQFTGGTTGTPKAATLTHRNLVAALFTGNELGQPISQIIPIERRNIMGVLPCFHVFGEICGIAMSTITVSTLVILPRFDVDEFMATMERIPHIWFFPAVATMLGAIINHPRVKEINLPKKISIINAGAAPCSLDLLHKAREMGFNIVEGWGMSETTSVGITTPFFGVKKPLSIGLPYPDAEVKFIDVDTGKEVPLGEPGELLMKSPMVMKGYWNEPEETAKQLVDGWLHTGDIAYQDEDGYIFIVDRAKDLIIAGGYNIYPQEIDNLLLQHPQVVDAMTIGIPDEYRGETVKSFIQLIDGATVNESDLIAYCREHLAAYKAPRSVEIRASLPRSATGKALKRILKNEELAKMKKK
ncbi:MAG TPA: AMP-binding protein [Syntrophomonas sp.]|nr:AMP-binding protein [Syntrophomonas sp.]